MAEPHRKTCKRYNTPGEAHALTFSCVRRQAFLSKDASRQRLIEGIDLARVKQHFHVWAQRMMQASGLDRCGWIGTRCR